MSLLSDDYKPEEEALSAKPSADHAYRGWPMSETARLIHGGMECVDCGRPRRAHVQQSGAAEKASAEAMAVAATIYAGFAHTAAENCTHAHCDNRKLWIAGLIDAHTRALREERDRLRVAHERALKLLSDPEAVADNLPRVVAKVFAIVSGALDGKKEG